MKKMKHSRQRDAILEFLISRKDHPTAETIYINVKKVYPKISLGTVYRNLTLLQELGKVKRISCGDGTEHFDADISSHNHFICKSCKSITDIKMENIDFITTLASNSFDGIIEEHRTLFYGICRDCLIEKNSQKDVDT